MESLLGGLLGGVLRLIPEWMNARVKAKELDHEIKLLEKNMEFEKLKAASSLQTLRETGEQASDAGAMTALLENIRAQGKPSGVAWVDALSASVRPVLTYWWCLVLYTAALISKGVLMYGVTDNIAVTIDMLWGAEEKAIVSSILMFWFVGRTIPKK